MARNTNSIIAAALSGFLLTGGAASAQDYGQLAAAAGLSPSEARGLSLQQIAANYFNRSADSDDQQTVPSAAAQPRQRVSSRALGAAEGRYAQLIAAADLSSEEAAAMSLNEIAARFFARTADSD